ncbi:WXG100 family type VII secretion target [Streptomyces niger]|uniref:WXG100 family type VII secretion target n=1 Tax=Streptomyces niger TaxID=66373 RepID=UPI00069A8F8E|nr:WXG100 family type VII secretion target [Streptomyces niger]
MSGDESVAEEIVELGIEIVNPGGRPEELEKAAKAWRTLKTQIDQTFSTLDKEVSKAVGHAWRGEAAEAFHDHWLECKSSVGKMTEQFDEAAEGLDDAAKAIREVNSEIHDIYKEIGISVAISVGMSFLTMGVSAAVGTARIAMLAEKALAAAGKLGRMLKAIAQAYRALKNLSTAGWVTAGIKGLESLAVNTATGTAGGVATSLLSGKGPEWETNLAGGVAGATVGAGAGNLAARLGANNFASGMVGGAVGGVGGDALDNQLKDKPTDFRQSAITAIAGGAAGGLSSETRGIGRDMNKFVDDVRWAGSSDNNWRAVPEHHEARMDIASGTVVPIAGGVAANEAKDTWDPVDKSVEEGRSKTEQGVPRPKETATDEVRDVFG